MADMKRKIILDLLARNKAKGEMAAFSRGVTTLTRSVRRMAGGLLLAAGVGGIGYMIKQQMTAIDSIAKMSDELDISTRALSGLEHAAKISGSSIETIHKSLEIFVRRLGEAEQGFGEGKRGLEMMNMSAKELIDLGTENAFMKITDSIYGMETAAQRAGAAYNMFGRQGVQLLNLMQTGSGSIKELIKEADKLGLTFSNIDARQVELANDSLTRTKAVFTGLFRQTTIQLAPYISSVSDAFVDFATQGKGVGVNVINAFELMSRGAIAFGTEIEKLPLSLMKTESWLLKLQGTWEKISPAGMAKGLLRGKNELSPWQQADIIEREIKARQRAATGRDTATAEWFKNLRSDVSSRTPGVESVKLNQVREEAELEATKISALVTDKAAAMSKMYSQMGKMSEASYQARLKLIEQEKQTYIEASVDKFSIDQWRNEQLTKLEIEYLRSSDSIVKGFQSAGMQIKREMTTWGERASEFTFSMRDSFASGLENMGRDMDNFGEHAKAMFDEIYWSAMRIALIKPMAAEMTSGISGLLGGAKAAGEGATALGEGAAATALTTSATALTTSATALTASVTALTASGTALGTSAVALGTSGTALGTSAVALGTSGTALGTSALALGTSGTALGTSALALGASGTALGASALALGTSGTTLVAAGGALIAAAASLETSAIVGAIFHEGGIVGKTPSPIRAVPAGTFSGAPRLHSGLSSDEFPAILQRGEIVLPRGSGGSTTPAEAAPMTVIINNNVRGLSIEAEEDQKERVLEIVIDAAETDGPYRAAHGLL